MSPVVEHEWKFVKACSTLLSLLMDDRQRKRIGLEVVQCAVNRAVDMD